MSTKYEFTKKGSIWNEKTKYEDIDFKDYYINIESNNKEFIDFMDRKLDNMIEEFKHLQKLK